MKICTNVKAGLTGVGVGDVEASPIIWWPDEKAPSLPKPAVKTSR